MITFVCSNPKCTKHTDKGQRDNAGRFFCGVDCMLTFHLPQQERRHKEPLQGDPGDETKYDPALRLDLE